MIWVPVGDDVDDARGVRSCRKESSSSGKSVEGRDAVSRRRDSSTSLGVNHGAGEGGGCMMTRVGREGGGGRKLLDELGRRRIMDGQQHVVDRCLDGVWLTRAARQGGGGAENGWLI